MKMRWRIITAVSALSMVLVAGGVFAAGKVVPRPIGTDPARYVENPAPQYPDNANAPEASLIPREQILAYAANESGGQLVSVELRKWQEHEQQYGKSMTTLIGPNRMVWVMTLKFDTYQDLRLGTLKDVQAVYAYDAQTGQMLHRHLDWKSGGRREE